MKDFVYNTTLGKCFFAEFGNFIQSNCINGTSDFYDDVFMVIFEEYSDLSADELKQLTLIAYRYNLAMVIRAESDSLIIEFERTL